MKSSKVSVIALAMAGAVMTLTACSGGGGGSPTPTPTPTPTATPTPTGSAPDVTIDTPDGSSADERQSITLDASGSTDADGDTLSFSWSQTSGPAAEFSDTDQPQITVRFPEVDADQELTFEVEVSDGTYTSTETVDLTVKNIVLEPNTEVFATEFDRLEDLKNPRGSGLGPYDPLLTSDLEFSFVEDTETESRIHVLRQSGSRLFEPYSMIDLSVGIDQDVSRASLWTGFSSFVALGFQQSGKLFPNVLSNERTEVEIDPFCSLTGPYRPSDRIVAIGRENGLDVVFLNYALDGVLKVERLADSGTYCEIESADGQGIIYALESSTNVIDIWIETAAGYERKTSIELGIPASLDPVAFTKLSASVFALVFSDGKHEGDHRLVIINNPESQTEVEVIERRWTKGVPADLISVSVGSDAIQHLVMPLKTAPYVAVVEGRGNSMILNRLDLVSDVHYAASEFGVTEIQAGKGSSSKAFYALIIKEAGEISFVLKNNQSMEIQ